MQRFHFCSVYIQDTDFIPTENTCVRLFWFWSVSGKQWSTPACIKPPPSGEQCPVLYCQLLSPSREWLSVLGFLYKALFVLGMVVNTVPYIAISLPGTMVNTARYKHISISGTFVNSALYTAFFVWRTVVHIALSIIGDHCFNWDSMVEGKAYLAHQITHTVPFIKYAECNTDDLHRGTFTVVILLR